MAKLLILRSLVRLLEALERLANRVLNPNPAQPRRRRALLRIEGTEPIDSASIRHARRLMAAHGLPGHAVISDIRILRGPAKLSGLHPSARAAVQTIYAHGGGRGPLVSQLAGGGFIPEGEAVYFVVLRESDERHHPFAFIAPAA